jgi:DNA repair exonuclease SbcCD nuclease subunit
MKILLITDTHSGARNDSPQFNDYFLKFYNTTFFPYLKEHPEIKHIVHLGDVFDRRKYVNFKTLLSWQENVFDPLSKTGCEVHIIVGNHDTYYKNTNNINSVNQLLDKYDWKIYTEPTTTKIAGLDICLLPWICDDNNLKSMEEIKQTNADVCFGHLEIQGFDLFPGHTNVDHGVTRDIFERFSLVLSGHFHHKSTQGNITYLGSPYPMTWSDWGDVRGFHVFDTETYELEFIENPHQIFQKIFYNDVAENYQDVMSRDFSHYKDMYIKIVVQQKTNPYQFDQLIECLQKFGPCDISIVESVVDSVYENQGDLDQAQDTLTILLEYVDGLSLSEGSSELKQILQDLYSEALSSNDSIQNS